MGDYISSPVKKDLLGTSTNFLQHLQDFCFCYSIPATAPGMEHNNTVPEKGITF